MKIAAGLAFFVRPRVAAFAFVFALAAALPFIAGATAGKNTFFFEIDLCSSQAGSARLLYDTGRGYHPEESVCQQLRLGARPAGYRFVLPAGYFRGLRFDPIDRPGKVVFSDARIVDKYGAIIRRFPARRFRPAHATARIAPEGRGRQIRTSPGGDRPSFIIEFGPPFRLRVGPKYWVRSASTAFLVVFLALLAIAALPASRLGSQTLAKLFSTARAHPARAIASASLLVVALQCHPVLFFGKSFVSPNNPVLLLYDRFPTLPGYQSEEIENSNASDIGALMWWHLDCPVIAHDALFRDGELPLWNRASMCGLPSLGQGQSMFGDPLNFLSILSRSAAWSWDARFVIARWLLCCGIGLTIFALSRQLSAALLGTIGAGFLGFFGFRLNHPANFSLGYSAWILFAWIGLIQSGSRRQAARWSLGLMAVNFCVMNSGTVKEAYVLLLCLNLAGLMLWAAQSAPRRLRFRNLSFAAGAGLAFILLTAPWWRTFIAALKHSWTSFDQPAAVQVLPSLLIGFFDDLFSRQLQPGETVHIPAANFLFLSGLLWSMAAIGHVSNRRTYGALALGAVLPFAMVFGIIPGRFIIHLPFIANIVHIGETFACPLLIMVAVMAGFGFAASTGPVPEWRPTYFRYLALAGCLYALYFGSTQATPKSAFFVGYAGSMTLALLLLPIGLHRARTKNDVGLGAAVLVAAIVLFTWRHGQYLRTPFDDYVFNPQVRARLDAPSPAVAFVNSRMREPSRPLGFGANIFSGYSAILGWESILGVDPLRNPYYDELAAALGIGRVLNADIPTSESDFARFQKGLDLLNVRYYLAAHRAPPADIDGLLRLGQFDLDVYESASSWPRAFFTDRLFRYESVAQFTAKISAGDGRPFAAAQASEPLPPSLTLLPGDLPGRSIYPAADYRMTTNTTSFRVRAPSAGVVVLSENFVPYDFQLRVNGQPRDYFRVNHAFKGVYLDRPGLYRIEFKYWPRSLSFSLQLAALGTVILGLLVGLAVGKDPPAKKVIAG